MEIVLIVAMLIVAVTVLYVAATLSMRTRHNTAPLIDDAVRRISREIAEELRGQLQEIAAELRRDREQARLEERKIQGRLDHADRQVINMSEQFLTELAALRRLGDQVAARQDQFGDDLRQLDRQHAHEADLDLPEPRRDPPGMDLPDPRPEPPDVELPEPRPEPPDLAWPPHPTMGGPDSW